MKIALIQCPQWSTLVPPYNIALLAACLKDSGHDVFCYDFNLELQRTGVPPEGKTSQKHMDWYDRKQVRAFIEKNTDYIDRLIEKVISKDIQVAGFSVYDSSRWCTEEVARRIKVRKSSVKVVTGGFSCFRPRYVQEMLASGNIDAVCSGEGEFALGELLTNLERNGDFLSPVPGVVIGGRPENLPSDTERPPVNLDFLPFADFSQFDLRLYEKMGLPISTSRGCINRCLFCEESALWKTYRCRSAENIYSEILYQSRKYPGIEYFHFNDSLINGDMEILDELVERILGGRFHFHWGGQVALREGMDLRFLKRIRKAGLGSVSYGLESGSENVLKAMGKKISLEVAERIIRDSKRVGMFVGVNIVVGFPGETWSDVNQTVRFLKYNRTFIDHISIHPLVLLPAAFLFRKKDDLGIRVLNEDSLKGWEIPEENNTFAERLQRARFIQKALGPKAEIPFHLLKEDEK